MLVFWGSANEWQNNEWQNKSCTKILQLSTTNLVQHSWATFCSHFMLNRFWFHLLMHLIAFDCIWLHAKTKSYITFIASSFNVCLSPLWLALIKIKYLTLLASPFVTFAVLLSTRSIIFKQAFHWSMQFKVFLRTLRL